VTVLLEVVAQATKLLGPGFDAEIVELHHHHKKDAPSGTGLALGREGPTVQMAAALGEGWARIFKLRPGDHRALLAAAVCHLPCPVRGARLVTPRMLLRWHRALVRRKWRRPRGKRRPPSQ
jgi:hypothetical protein